jgi:hypothetical protein
VRRGDLPEAGGLPALWPRSVGEDAAPLRHQVWELPEIKPQVVEYRRHRLACPCCGETTCAALPPGVPRGQSGPRLVAFAGLLMAYFRQSKRRTALFLETLLNQPCCPALTLKMQAQVTQALRPAYEELAAALPSQQHLGIDESPTKEASINYVQDSRQPAGNGPGETASNLEVIFRCLLRPKPEVEKKRIRQLIANLDADAFMVREKASEELSAMGRIAMPALKQSLQGKPSLELARRVRQLLEKLEGKGIPSDRLRGLRATEALERIGTPLAREVLQMLVERSSEPSLVQDAKVSLLRLTKRIGKGF